MIEIIEFFAFVTEHENISVANEELPVKCLIGIWYLLRIL
jgi:hypothetical protein